MNPDLLPKLINSAGLLFDIAGACFVAWEVVQQFKGKQYKSTFIIPGLPTMRPPEKTPEFDQWEQNKYRKMKVGLGLLIIGFLLQVASNWTCYLF